MPKIPPLKKKKIDWSKVDPDSLTAALHWDKMARPGDDQAPIEEKAKDAGSQELPGERLSIFKQADGSFRWVLFSSNAFRDYDGEYLSTKALEEDVNRSDQSREYGPLRWWHVGSWASSDPSDWLSYKAGPGVDIGDCDFRMMKERVLVESGTFRDQRVGAALQPIAERLQASVGFSHPRNEPDQGGVFHHVKCYERSLLPKGNASNRFTKFLIEEVPNMASIKEKIKVFADLLKDPELVNMVLNQADLVQKEATDQGVSFKEDGTQAAKVEEKAAPPPPAPEKKGSGQKYCADCEKMVTPDDAGNCPTCGADLSKAPSEAPAEVTTKKEGETEAAVEEPAGEEQELALPDYVGDMEPMEFAGMLRDIVSDVVSGSQAARQQAQKELDDLTTVKEANAALLKRVEKLEGDLTAAKETIQELTSAQPRSVKAINGQRPTQSKENVTGEQSQERKPGPDPAFVAFATGQGQQQ